MIEANKTYGFTIAVKELRETVPNIFRYASAYKRLNNITSQGLWEMFVEPQPEQPEEELSTDENPPLPEEIMQNDPNQNTLPDIDPEAMEGEKYNMCHFWSNFEIARLSWFRSKEYQDFFEMMDRSGGFWMERVSRPLSLFRFMTDRHSGVTHPFTRSPPVPFSVLKTFTTSAILATDTRPSSTAQPMPLPASSPAIPTSRWPTLMRNFGKKKTSTGRTGTRRRRTESAVAVAATLTSLMSKARKVPVWPSGLM